MDNSNSTPPHMYIGTSILFFCSGLLTIIGSTISYLNEVQKFAQQQC